MPISLIVSSTPESRRFGLLVGRFYLDGEPEDQENFLAEIQYSQWDVVILRYPSRKVALFAELLKLSGQVPIFADSLLYWEHELLLGPDREELNSDLTMATLDVDEVAELVPTTFVHYPSHYAANPLFSPERVLEGYVEWVTGLIARGEAVCLGLMDSDAQCAAWAIIDLNHPVPDIRFGGIAPEFRGRGYYRELIASSMSFAKERGYSRIAISTQVHNVAVMATWASLGWRPVKALTTVHLVRKELLL